jgi:hypothetical protein
MEDAAQFLPDPCSDGLTRSAMDAPLLLLVAEAAVLLVTSSAAYFWALWLERGAQAGRPKLEFGHFLARGSEAGERLGWGVPATGAPPCSDCHPASPR